MPGLGLSSVSLDFPWCFNATNHHILKQRHSKADSKGQRRAESFSSCAFLLSERKPHLCVLCFVLFFKIVLAWETPWPSNGGAGSRRSGCPKGSGVVQSMGMGGAPAAAALRPLYLTCLRTNFWILSLNLPFPKFPHLNRWQIHPSGSSHQMLESSLIPLPYTSPSLVNKPCQLYLRTMPRINHHRVSCRYHINLTPHHFLPGLFQ